MFDLSPAAAQARLAAFDAVAYARSRNHLAGTVSGLSPYVTHGLLRLPDVYSAIHARQPLGREDKFSFELGWRAYYRHVWAHRGEGIFESLHPGVLPDDTYARTLPRDLIEGRTGLPVIDLAVHTLYATGLLHNHARMWLACYCVHLRKLHWRVCADWLYAHLLDGDLASNALSWQWVAGTGSSKPYLFNAENVAKYAPAAWHSPGSVIDTSYDALDALARSPEAVAPGGAMFGIDPPGISPEPPAGLRGWPLAVRPDAASVRGRRVRLRHAWDLGDLPADPAALDLIVFSADFHARWPWARQRWAVIGARLAALDAVVWWGTEVEIGTALQAAAEVTATHDPHAGPALARWARCTPEPALFTPVTTRCDSFSAWWRRSSLLTENP